MLIIALLVQLGDHLLIEIILLDVQHQLDLLINGFTLIILIVVIQHHINMEDLVVGN